MSPPGGAAVAMPLPSHEANFVPAFGGDGLLTRPELERALDGHASKPLTLLSAPCGYGKTSLLASWVGRSPPGAVAWLTLEPADDHGARFWSKVCEAIERVRPGVVRGPSSLLRARGTSVELALHELLAELAAARPLTVVLDDLHVVKNRDCLAQLDYVAEHLPSGVHIVIGTRSDPALPLGRLRARGVLGEIRARDLVFSFEETRALLRQTAGLEIDDEECAMLVERTEGWPVAVYLTGLWLRDQDDPRTRIRELAAGRQYIGEYLFDEILSGLDEDRHAFLVRTSMLDYLSAELCDVVLGRRDSRELLQHVSDANLLISRLEPGSEWFRVHRLFRELLQLDLQRTETQWTVTELHRRATAWLREHGYLEGAVTHALAAGEPGEAAEIISRAWVDLLSRGEGETLLRLVERVPVEVMLEKPELAAGSALATYLARRPQHERSRWLAVVERSRRASPGTWSTWAGATASLARAIAIDGDVGQAAVHARRGLRLIRRGRLPEGTVSGLSALAYACYLAGSSDDARKHAAASVAAPETADRPVAVVRALGVLALIDADEGRGDEASARAEHALAFARAHGLLAAASVHVAQLARSRALVAQGRLHDAEHAAQLAERLCRMPDPCVQHAFALIVLAEAQIKSGRLAFARASLRAASREIGTFSDPGMLPRLLGSARRALRRARNGHRPDAVEDLSEAELAVLRLLPTTLSQRGIGRRLFLSVNTIKTHSRSIYRKLGVTSRRDAVARATALELIEPARSYPEEPVAPPSPGRRLTGAET